MQDEWKKISVKEALGKLRTGEKGIPENEKDARLLEYGRNEIAQTKKASVLKILISQFISPLILILIVAAAVSAAISFLPGVEGGLLDAVLILLIVIASGVFGFIQDWKAEKAIEALRQMSAPKARVIRDGIEKEIPASQIVPGDVVVVETGNIIPADGKIIRSSDLTVDESILTGESCSVRKEEGDVVCMSTSVASGKAFLVIFATGMKTEIGRLAEKMEEIEETKTPFQKELEVFSKKISWIIISIALAIFVIGYFKYGLYQAFLTAVSLAVAAIPEGLPAVVTLALALGAKTMVKSNALIRKLPVVESVGSVDVICTDKTGTLTRNRMSVTQVYFIGEATAAAEINSKNSARVEMLLRCGALCNNSSLGCDENGNKKTLGDQTEVALREFSDRAGYLKEKLDNEYARTKEIAFTSKRKMMSVVCRKGGSDYVFSKGAPEVLIKLCTKIYDGRRVRALDKKEKEKILSQNSAFASKALRVLAFAYKEPKKKLPEKEIEKDLVFIGLIGMHDPPREEAREAIADCVSAGIRIIMLTGDSADTARAIADLVGLESRGTMTGDMVETITDAELEKRLDGGTNIFARISPFHKLRILEMLQKKHRVAMTGDGVNDALALKKADVGIAMGERGTEVAKEASDIILIDDNFATIRNTVREGRRIFDNIRKFVSYLLSCNLAEVLVISLSTIFISLEEPVLLPANILWINLLTDGIPALALGVDPASPDIMKKKPRKMKEGILDRKTLQNIVITGIVLSIFLALVLYTNLPLGIRQARTALFTGFVIYEFLRIAVIREQEALKFFDNKILLLAMSISVILQLVIVYTPLGVFFGLEPLSLYQWEILLLLGAGGWVSLIVLSKLTYRKAR